MAKLSKGFSLTTAILGVVCLALGICISVISWVLASKAPTSIYHSVDGGSSGTYSYFTPYWWGGFVVSMQEVGQICRNYPSRVFVVQFRSARSKMKPQQCFFYFNWMRILFFQLFTVIARFVWFSFSLICCYLLKAYVNIPAALVYLHLIQKDSITHIHDLAVYVKNRLLLVWDLPYCYS